MVQTPQASVQLVFLLIHRDWRLRSFRPMAPTEEEGREIEESVIVDNADPWSYSSCPEVTIFWDPEDWPRSASQQPPSFN